jgi:predicted metal-dependent hydrolase
MAQKIIAIPEVGEIVLQKRRGNRSVRLSVGNDGIVRVSLPAWSPYHVGEAFARSKAAWIRQQQLTRQHHVFNQHERIGKSHRLIFTHQIRRAVSARVTKTELRVKLPLALETTDPSVQAAVQKAAIRALKQEASQLLPGRVRDLAAAHGFTYASVSIKHLRSRWGSCSSQKHIALNCFLMQLPWELIDYVILHELVHTRIMAHGPAFWDELGKYVTNLTDRRKRMRAHQPMLRPQE